LLRRPKEKVAMNTDNTSPETFNHVYARDRAAAVTCAVLAILRAALDDPELRSRIAATLRFEFADLEHQVLSENRSTD
jgi:hypothetical protein